MLKKPLDYEKRSSYEMIIRAQDRGLKQSLSSTTNILIEINDIQDQPPQFLNAPYTETVAENTSPVSINMFIYFFKIKGEINKFSY